MSERPSLLLISNGYGEDMISKILSYELRKEGFQIKAMPLVGKGTVFESSDVEVIGPKRELPSGGFCTRSLRYLLLDLFCGLFTVLFSQIREMQRVKKKIDFVVCIGDLYPVILSFLFISKPIFLVATYKSVYTGGYLWIEKVIMRRYCKAVFTRDEPTARSLQVKGIKASFVGNPIMDCIPEIPPPKTHTYTIGLLPGSRNEAYLNLKDILRKVEAIFYLFKKEKVYFLVSIAPSLDIEKIRRRLPSKWRLRKGEIFNPTLGVGIKMVGFEELLRNSHLVVGLAGTANEQAAGVGRPVVTFAGHGPQTTPSRMKEQKRLLGKAISLVKNKEDIVSKEVFRILKNEIVAKEMGEEGRRRMGKKGGVKKIASLIIDNIENKSNEEILS